MVADVVVSSAVVITLSGSSDVLATSSVFIGVANSFDIIELIIGLVIVKSLVLVTFGVVVSDSADGASTFFFLTMDL